jgi:AcrR family transcriptional regulator
MTTNQIADRAGVNIASLYQYFPNKQAIVVELMRRHVDRTRRAVIPVFERTRSSDAALGVRALLEIVAAEHSNDPELHQIFTTIGPQLGFEAIETDVDSVFADASARWARSMRGALPDPELTIWIVKTAVHAVFHTAFVERPDIANSPLLVDELVRLVTRYLAPVSGTRSRPSRRGVATRRPRDRSSP